MEKKQCVSCGKTVLAISKSCKYCGNSLEAPPTETQIFGGEEPLVKIYPDASPNDDYPEVQDEQTTFPNDYPEVMEEIRNGNKLAAMKKLKELTGWDLLTCREWVDNHEVNNAPEPNRFLSEVENKPFSSEKKAPALPKRITQYKKSPVKESKQNPWLLIIATLLLLFGGGLFAYYQWYTPYKTDRDAPRCYTMVNLILRSEMIKTNFTVITTLTYGSELIVYKIINDEWAEVKWGDTKGYVSSLYLLNKEDFYLLNSIFGDDSSFDNVDMYRYRRALIDYYKSRQLYGKPQTNMPDSYQSYEKNWQVFTKEKNIKPNTVLFSRVLDKDSKYTDFAVIIKNTDTNERRLLVFGFDGETENAAWMHEETAPATGDIKDITFSGTTCKATYTK